MKSKIIAIILFLAMILTLTMPIAMAVSATPPTVAGSTAVVNNGNPATLKITLSNGDTATFDILNNYKGGTHLVTEYWVTVVEKIKGQYVVTSIVPASGETTTTTAAPPTTTTEAPTTTQAPTSTTVPTTYTVTFVAKYFGGPCPGGIVATQQVADGGQIRWSDLPFPEPAASTEAKAHWNIVDGVEEWDGNWWYSTDGDNWDIYVAGYAQVIPPVDKNMYISPGGRPITVVNVPTINFYFGSISAANLMKSFPIPANFNGVISDLYMDGDNKVDAELPGRVAAWEAANPTKNLVPTGWKYEGDIFSAFESMTPTESMDFVWSFTAVDPRKEISDGIIAKIKIAMGNPTLLNESLVRFENNKSLITLNVEGLGEVTFTGGNSITSNKTYFDRNTGITYTITVTGNKNNPYTYKVTASW